MYAAGQNLVAGHSLDLFNAAGAQVASATFAANVANSVNQSTLVAATPTAESQFGIAADTGMPGGSLDPGGGASAGKRSTACLGELPRVCPLPSRLAGRPVGDPGRDGAAPNDRPGCPTLLEASDDTDSSAADFADVFPAPRPNSVAPSEHACASHGTTESGYPHGGTPGRGGGRGGLPQTRIGRHPGRMTRDRTPTFRFSSNLSGAAFLCKLDRRPFSRCRSPFTTPRLRPGRHVFRVKARVPGGATDRSPAVWRFRVVARR